MKKLILSLSLSLISFISFSQEKDNYVKEDFFYTSFESGIGEIVPIKFKLGSDFINKLEKNEIYLLWEQETFSNLKNTEYIEKHKNKTHIEIFLMGSTLMASFYTKLKLKNGASYTPISNSEGFVYISDNNEIHFSFPFKAQNGYGNMLIAKSYYTENIKDGKRNSSHFVSSN